MAILSPKEKEALPFVLIIFAGFVVGLLYLAVMVIVGP